GQLPVLLAREESTASDLLRVGALLALEEAEGVSLVTGAREEPGAERGEPAQDARAAVPGRRHHDRPGPECPGLAGGPILVRDRPLCRVDGHDLATRPHVEMTGDGAGDGTGSLAEGDALGPRERRHRVDKEAAADVPG